ncbi:MAG: hypothetical protein GF320_10120 [Armatimonadia bacterium]|nr:hypothetical protein [Armatimonadia bacterium]
MALPDAVNTKDGWHFCGPPLGTPMLWTQGEYAGGHFALSVSFDGGVARSMDYLRGDPYARAQLVTHRHVEIMYLPPPAMDEATRGNALWSDPAGVQGIGFELTSDTMDQEDLNALAKDVVDARLP